MDITVRMLNGIANIEATRKPRTTHQALSSSIDKWKVIVALIRGGIRVSDGGPSSCALCQKFYRNNCRGCPVRKVTKCIQCTGSPYDKWEACDLGDETIEMARNELKFLESLKA